MHNTLALVQAIERKVHAALIAEEAVKYRSALVVLAHELGISDDAIFDALYSDRQLVIYEP